MPDWSRYLADVPVEHREEVERLLEESGEAVWAREEIERLEIVIKARRHPKRRGLMNGRRTRTEPG